MLGILRVRRDWVDILEWCWSGWWLILRNGLRLAHGESMDLIYSHPQGGLTGCDVVGEVRIVTLAPAITQILVDLGQGGLIVGVAENDLAAPGVSPGIPPGIPPGNSHGASSDLPVVGNYLRVNIEALISVRPTHVFMMVGKGGVPENLQRLSESRGFVLVGYGYPKSVGDLADIIAAGGEGDEGEGERLASIGEVLGVERLAGEVRRRMVGRLEEIKLVTDGEERLRVLMVIYSNPLMASGPGSINDQLLEYVGAVNAAGDAVTSAPTFDREKLLAVNPDVVLFISPKGAELGSVADDPRLGLFRGLGINAVRDGRIYLIDDPLAQLPTTTLPRIAGAMAKALHPGLSDRIDEVFLDTMCGEEEAQTQPSAGDDVEPR